MSNIFKISFWLFCGLLFFLISTSEINAATITFTADTQLDLSGAGTPVYIESGSAADSLTVTTSTATSTVDASIPLGTTFTLSTSTSNILALTAAGNTVWLGFDTNNFSTGYITQWVASSSDTSAEVDFTVKVPSANTYYSFTVGGNAGGHALSDASAFVGYNYTSGFSTSNLTFALTAMSGVPSGGGGGGGGGGGSSTPSPSPSPSVSPSPSPSPTASPSPSPTVSPSPTPTPIATPTPITGISAEFSFSGNLKLNQVSNDIKFLQIILNSDPDTKIAESGGGSPGNETTFFGAKTKAAVIKFQEKYASEILSPVGLAKGTGIIGPSTRAKLNSLLGALPSASPVSSPSPSVPASIVSITNVPSDFTFKLNLKLSQTSDDIKYLQIILNSDPDTKVAEAGPGSPGSETTKFGALTKAAVIKFQEKYGSEILTPVGLTKGTGLVGLSTRAKLNTLIGK